MGNFLPLEFSPALIASGTIEPGEILAYMAPELLVHDSVSQDGKKLKPLPTIGRMFYDLWTSTGIYDIIQQTSANFSQTWILGLGRVLMMLVALVLLYLAVFKEFEPLLLLPIGFGAILSNIPLAGISGPDGLLGMVYNVGIESGVFPLLIFMGVGAMTDFGPLIANPKTALLGGGAQLGIFFALIGALVLAKCGIDFDIKDAASIGIIGGADGPTSIFLTTRLSPKLLGAVAVAAYSYMALVPIIQPPIMRAMTTKSERLIRMKQLRNVSKLEKVCFPILITFLCAFLLPDAAPLIGMLMLGNFMKEVGVVDRLSDTAQNALINIVTIFLGLSVGSKLSADRCSWCFRCPDGGASRQQGRTRIRSAELPSHARYGTERRGRDRIGCRSRCPPQGTRRTLILYQCDVSEAEPFPVPLFYFPINVMREEKTALKSGSFPLALPFFPKLLTPLRFTQRLLLC